MYILYGLRPLPPAPIMHRCICIYVCIYVYICILLGFRACNVIGLGWWWCWCLKLVGVSTPGLEFRKS